MVDAEADIRKIKLSLQNWREIILPLNAVLTWQKQWHACALIGGSTFLFMSIWLMDPSLLTTFAILGLTLTISDYLVPLLTSSMIKSDKWTEKKDKQFDDICRTIFIYYNTLLRHYRSYASLRTNKPKLYYGCTIIILLLLAWIGNNINNLFLTYLVVTFIILTPGMEHTGILRMYGKILTEKIGDMATNAKLKVGQVKKD